ncbi:MAG: glycosyl transferase group 1, partial [uncultured bacterium]
VHDLVAFILPEGHNRKAMWIERLTLKRALKKAYRIVTVSENTKQDLKTRFKINDEKIILTPCAASNIFIPRIKKSIMETVTQKYRLPDRFILGVGTLSPRKNFTRLMKAYERLALTHPEVHLVIVGDWGWCCEEIRKESGHPNIHLIGYVEGTDLAAIYNLAEIFVFPSLYEGFGIPPLEAMACGCPVIVSNNSSLPEVVGEAGLKIDPYSISDITNAMEKILNESALREKLIEFGFKQARKFSWKRSAEHLKKEFYSLSKKAVQ